jgi:hypothetical protein
MRTVSEAADTNAATQPVAKTMSAPKLAAKETSPTIPTSDQPSFRREEKALNYPYSGTVFCDRFFAVN